MPIPEDEESSRILAERSHEVVQVTVGVSLPEERDEPEDDPGEAKALGVGFDEALAGELGRPVQGRLDGKWAVLGGRHNDRLAVDGARGSKEDATRTHGPHRLEPGE